MKPVEVRTLVEALDRPSTLAALRRKTGYSTALILKTILVAHSMGVRIKAHARGTHTDYEPTYYTLED